MRKPPREYQMIVLHKLMRVVNRQQREAIGDAKVEAAAASNSK